ncbi:hypothetical protein [Natrinema halophilum]|nr:hypothetical protein [Natrinema halophilum]
MKLLGEEVYYLGDRCEAFAAELDSGGYDAVAPAVGAVGDEITI